MEPEEKVNILLVDDDEVKLLALENILSGLDQNLVKVHSGKEALRALLHQDFAVVLLDVRMPVMDGFETAAIMREREQSAHLPIIFVTAADRSETHVARGYSLGAVDYIYTPIVPEFLRAKVAVFVELKAARRALKRQNEHLEETVAARTRKLAKANERLTILDRSKNDFLNLISHEFRTPLNGLLGVGELILDEMSSTVEHNELKEMFQHSRRRILSILDDVLLLTQIDVSGEKFRLAPVSLSTTLNRAIERAAAFAESRHVTLNPLSPGMDLTLGDEDLLVRAFHALLETAVKFSEEGAAVRLAREVFPDSVRIVIESHGRTIPSPAIANFFELFAIGEASTPGGDLGLGPPVASCILSLFGASISVANRDPSGIRLTVSLKGCCERVLPLNPRRFEGPDRRSR